MQTDADIYKKMFASSVRPLDLAKWTALIISNEKMNDSMKIVKYLKECDLLINRVGQIIKNEAKEQKGGFLSTLLGILSSSLLGNLLTDKLTIRAGGGTIATSKWPYTIGKGQNV